MSIIPQLKKDKQCGFPNSSLLDILDFARLNKGIQGILLTPFLKYLINFSLQADLPNWGEK